jgi:hypothetical protein
MKSDRIISYSCALALAASIALPASAQAGSVLSGYGGPGQGNQAVLGSALIGGPRGGGSGGSGGSASSTGSNVEGSSAGEASSAAGTDAHRSGSGTDEGGNRPTGKDRGGRGAAARERAGTPAQEQPLISPHGLYPAAEHIPAGGEGTVFGLTGDDLLYIVLAVAILALVGGLTRRLGDSPPGAPSGD